MIRLTALSMLLLVTSGCVSQSNLDHRLESAEQLRIQRDMLEVQREQLWEQQRRSEGRGRR